MIAKTAEKGKLDFSAPARYNSPNFIGQFVTILSVNKTRDLMGALRSFFVGGQARSAPIFVFGEIFMKQHTRHLAHAAIIAALYAVLTHMQNLLLPNSASFAIQMRLSEAMCILAFFTPAAIPGLSVGCLLFNLTFSAALPLDALVGTLATFLAAQGMWLTRNTQVRGIPLLGLTLPALTNAILVGWELTVYIGQAFWLNALYVAIGELIVLLIPGTALYLAMKKRNLDARLFGR